MLYFIYFIWRIFVLIKVFVQSPLRYLLSLRLVRFKIQLGVYKISFDYFQLPEGGAGSYNKTQEAVPLPNLQTSGTYPPPYIATVLDDLDDTDDIERTEQVSSNDPQASKSFREAPMSPPSRSASGPPQLKLPQVLKLSV